MQNAPAWTNPWLEMFTEVTCDLLKFMRWSDRTVSEKLVPKLISVFAWGGNIFSDIASCDSGQLICPISFNCSCLFGVVITGSQSTLHRPPKHGTPLWYYDRFFFYGEFLVQNATIDMSVLFSVWQSYFSSLFAIIGHLFDGNHLIGIGVACL